MGALRLDTRSRLGLCPSIQEMRIRDVIWADTVKEAEHLLQSLLQEGRGHV
ncbi:unnamed protein product [Symbiodinium sp. CCMP2456]|nr:unnamed protein product [Symbiodinium sp. CCMP2456]